MFPAVLAVGVAMSLLGVARAAACEPALRGAEVQRIDGARHVIAWRRPERVPLAEFIVIEFAACARNGGAIESAQVDARMPEHGHGMNYRAVVAAQGKQRFRATGLLLHMPGRWELAFAVGDGTNAETLRAPLVVD